MLWEDHDNYSISGDFDVVKYRCDSDARANNILWAAFERGYLLGSDTSRYTAKKMCEDFKEKVNDYTTLQP